MCFMQRYIYISGKGIINHFLGMGVSDICRLYELAQSGAVTNAEAMLKMQMKMDRPQVAFSTKSVVLRTPINWL